MSNARPIFSAPKRLSQPCDLGRRLDRGAADDDASDAIAQQVVDDRLRTHAAAHLDVERRAATRAAR